MFKSLVVALSLVAASAFAADAPMTPKEARETTLDFAAKLEANYMNPAVGGAYAKALRKSVADGAYDSISDPQAYADKVSADALAVHYDGHLKLKYASQGDAKAGGGHGAGSIEPLGERKWFADGVAYAKWRIFTGDDESIAAAEAFMKDFRGARAVVFDMREHHGGGLDEMDVFFKRLFSKPTHLVTMKIRQDKGRDMAAAFDSAPFLKRVPSRDGMDTWEHWTSASQDAGAWRKAKVYVLTSNKTASAAEHFTLALKTTGRGIIVGEKTYGAGNFGETHPIGERFTAFIAVGQTVDPKTDDGWDGAGIVPDVATPADQALEKALELFSATG
jgi:hypothetical protein